MLTLWVDTILTCENEVTYLEFDSKSYVQSETIFLGKFPIVESCLWQVFGGKMQVNVHSATRLHQ